MSKLNRNFKSGDPVTVKGFTYGSLRFHEYLPKGHAGEQCALVNVLHASTANFDFALVKTVRLIDVRAAGAAS